MNVTGADRAIQTSACILYTLIVLEILFMVSPFAAYYYSIYATPLHASPRTAWLTMYLLPHFSYSGCVTAKGLLLISCPLMLGGILLFTVGFCQIYWAKFTGSGSVSARSPARSTCARQNSWSWTWTGGRSLPVTPPAKGSGPVFRCRLSSAFRTPGRWY